MNTGATYTALTADAELDDVMTLMSALGAAVPLGTPPDVAIAAALSHICQIADRAGLVQPVALQLHATAQQLLQVCSPRISSVRSRTS